MKALALVLALALPAFAAPADAPVAMAVDAGFIAPTAGTFLPTPLDVDTANRLTEAESRPLKSTLVVVAAAAVTLAGACFAAGYVAGKKK